MFQFTHPGRGATYKTSEMSAGEMFQFTHPGRGATRTPWYYIRKPIVSIHAPREGCDTGVVPSELFNVGFQFTHPGRGATALQALPLS